MSEYYHIVPWFNSEEWHKVYNEIFVSTNIENALNLLQIWKARCPSLPSGIESTSTLLQVQIQDRKNTDNIVHDQLLRLAYSSAIMRFVNHMLDTETAKGTSLYKAAKNLGVPDWIVDLRHDTAHSNNLPPLTLLREACVISLNWLRTNYWDKYKLCIQDYVSGPKEEDTCEENKIAALIHFCISLSISAHPKCNIKKLSDIPNPSMRESIVNDARDLLGDSIDLSNLKTVSILSLINIMNTQSEKLLKVKDINLYVNKALLGEDSLFLSMELLHMLGDRNMNNKLKSNYVQCFEVLLTFLHTNDLLLELILGLVNITQSNDCGAQKTRLAALWVAEILSSLRKSKQFIKKINQISPDVMKSKKRKELKSLYYHWFPNEKSYGLLLDLCKPVPRGLTDIDFIQPIISKYNPYLAFFITDLLILIEPKLPNLVVEKVIKLAQVISTPKKFLQDLPEKIYTVDDLKVAHDLINTSTDVEIIQSDEDNNGDVTNNDNCEELVNSIWRLASNQYNWSTSPIGLLSLQAQEHMET